MRDADRQSLTNDPHTRQGISPLALAAILWRHRHLIWQMTKRDVVGRYRGTFLGLSWSFFSPLAMLGVHTFVFSEVFNARWGDGQAEILDVCVTSGTQVHTTSLRGDSPWRYDNSLEGGS